MFLILIITITFTLAARIPEPCCSKKTVGDLSYTLVNSEDTSIASRYGCKSNCVYQQDDSPGALFCFAVGDLPTNCTDAVSETASTKPTTTTKSAITTEDQFLYLSDSRILSLPSFEEVTCKQDFPEELFLNYATAGVVMDGNLLLCGGYGMTTCWLWTENGWLEKGTDFNRKIAAASSVGDSLIVTGDYDGNTSTMIFTEEAGWEDFTPLPVAMSFHCQVSVGDTVYVVRYDSTYKLSMSTKQWVKLSSLNTPRGEHGCAEWDGEIIVVGGTASGDYLSSVEKYDPVSDKWSTFTPLPTTLSLMQVLVWDNDLYVLGGYDGNSHENSKKVFKLKHGEDTWEELGVTLQNVEKRDVFPAVTLKTLHCT